MNKHSWWKLLQICRGEGRGGPSQYVPRRSYRYSHLLDHARPAEARVFWEGIRLLAISPDPRAVLHCDCDDAA